MSRLKKLALQFSANARQKRAELFLQAFHIDKTLRILDIGSEDGSNIYSVLGRSDYDPQKVYIADVDEQAVSEGHQKYGFNAVAMDENGSLPFADRSFDIVYCSSVIEHVTVSKKEVWGLRNGTEFRERSYQHQRQFANEIRRVAKQYFVQTPARTFLVESHTWMPLAGYLPRRLFVPTVRFVNLWWIKPSIPDFNLLDVREMRELFPEARIETETMLGLTKSIMAIKARGQK